jgi:hypothetical protein
MRCFLVAAAIAGLVALTGCSVRKVKAAPVAAPQPAPAVEPARAAVPEEPLSIPQTNVELPSPQPISPEALASIPPSQEQPEPIPPSRPARSRVTQGPARPETVSPETPPAVTETPPRSRIQALLPAEERLKIKEGVENRWREINDRLSRISYEKLPPEQKSTVERIRSFLSLSERAYNRGDMRQADSLSERALVLARDLERVNR